MAPDDFEEAEGELEFQSGQNRAHIALKIMKAGRYERKERFRLILAEPTGGASFDPEADGAPDQAICTIQIGPSEKDKQMLDKLGGALAINRDKWSLGARNYKAQFVAAIYVGGSKVSYVH